MEFVELRRSIAAAREMTYLNTGWAGPSPERVLARMSQAAEREAKTGPASRAGLAEAEAVREETADLLGRLLNAAPGDLLITRGTTEGVNIVLHGLHWEPGDELVTSSLEHPALNAPMAVLQERKGVTVKHVEIPPGASAAEALDAFQEALTPRTKLLAVSHIMYTCGLRLPAPEIVEAAHSVGALVLLDGAQTAGHVRLDIQRLGADFYAISGQKWLLGPTGSGALYIRPDRRDLLTPLFTRPGLDSRSGLRMHGLTADSTLLTAGLAEALQLHWELGPEAVETRIAFLAKRLREGLAAIPGVAVNGPTDSEASSGLTAIRVAGWEAAALNDRLWQDYRIAGRTVGNPAGVRFSTAPFNDEEDVERVIAAVKALA